MNLKTQDEHQYKEHTKQMKKVRYFVGALLENQIWNKVLIQYEEKFPINFRMKL